MPLPLINYEAYILFSQHYQYDNRPVLTNVKIPAGLCLMLLIPYEDRQEYISKAVLKHDCGRRGRRSADAWVPARPNRYFQLYR